MFVFPFIKAKKKKKNLVVTVLPDPLTIPSRSMQYIFQLNSQKQKAEIKSE